MSGEGALGAASPPPAQPPLASVVDCFVREISAGARVLGVVGPAACGTREVLDQLGARLAGSRTTLRTRGGILFPDELASLLLVALRAPAAADACAAFEARAVELARAGRPIVLGIEDGDSLLPITAHWLAALTGPPQPAFQIVVACQLERILRRSFPTEIGRVEVVRLSEVATAERAPPQVEVPDPQNGTPHLAAELAASDELRIEFLSGDTEPLIILPESPSEEERAPPEPARVIRPGSAPGASSEGSAATRAKRRDDQPEEDPIRAIAVSPRSGIGAGNLGRSRWERREGNIPSTEPAAIARGNALDVARGRARSARDRLRNSIAAFLIGFAGTLLLAVISLLLSRSPSQIDAESVTPQQEPLARVHPARMPVARSNARPPGAPVREESSPSRGRLDVLYDASTDRIRVTARGVQLHELLTMIAWQTGLHIESDVDLWEEVEFRFENVSLEEALARLLADYHSITLGNPEPEEPSPRSVWILIERSTSRPVAEALESVLQSRDPAQREDSARLLERQGSTSAAYALVDALSRAPTWDTAESRFLTEVRDRVTDGLCRTWAESAVGPQANTLRCD